MNIPSDLQNKAIILGVKIDDQPLDYFLRRTQEFMASSTPHKVFTPNPEICLKATKSEGYKNTLNSADLNLPDGFGLKLGAKVLGFELKNRVTGADFTKKLLDEYNSANLFVLLLDYSLTEPADLKKYFAIHYPNINLAVRTVKKASHAEPDLIEQINQHKTQILFICLGAPEQELWIDKNLHELSTTKIAFAVGGSFDFLTGKIKRAPKWFRNLGMEWLYRLYREPKRLIRIKHATADFLIECHKWAKRIENKFRTNVVGVIKNNKDQILIQKNIHLGDHWQFPQGGVDENEDPQTAVLREIEEELNICKSEMKIIKQFNAEHSYISPKHYQLLHGYKGQKQTAYLIKYSGSIESQKFAPTREVAAIEWIAKEKLLEKLHPVRREFVKKFINEI